MLENSRILKLFSRLCKLYLKAQHDFKEFRQRVCDYLYLSYFADNKNGGRSLKRLLLIITFIVSLSVFPKAQSISTASASTAGSILRFFPNPAVTFVTFDFQKTYESGYSIEVFNFLGKRVYEAKNLATRTTINLNDYNRGLYIYYLRDRNGKMVESGKFQVSK